MMKKENEQKLKKIICSVLDLDESSPVDKLRKITNRKWDSLAQITIISGIEDEFNTSISVAEYEQFTSYEAIKILLEDKDL